VGEKATEVEIFAAEELQRYIQLMSSAKLQIRRDGDEIGGRMILVGGSLTNCRTRSLEEAEVDWSFLGHDEFIVKTVGENLILAGSNSRGTLYSVYAFLERLGCRWFYPDEEIVPYKRTIKIQSLNSVERPSLKYRGFFPLPLPMRDLPWLRKLIDWTTKNRMNLFSTHSAEVFGCQWEKVRRRLIPELKKRGMMIKAGGHCYAFFLPPDRYFEEHPEWFSLVKGKRVPNNICFSNEEGVSTLKSNVLRYLEDHPEVDLIAIWPNDVPTLCECDKCRMLSPSDHVLRLVNRVSKAVHEAKPSIKVEHIAYWNYLVPPVLTTPERNVTVLFAARGRNYSYPFNHCDWGEWRDYVYKHYPPFPNDHNLSAFVVSDCRPYLRRWLEICGENDLYMHEYIVDNVLQDGMAPPMPHLIRADLRFYKEVGVRGVHPEMTSIYYWWPNCLTWYALFKLAWNVEADLEGLLDDYYQQCWGKARAPIRMFFEEIEHIMPDWIARVRQRWRRDLYSGGYPPSVLREEEEYHQQNLKRLRSCERHLKEAEELADDEAVLNRVRKARLWLEYITKRMKSVGHQLRAQRLLVEALNQPFPSEGFLENIKKARKALTQSIGLEAKIKVFISKNKEGAPGVFPFYKRDYINECREELDHGLCSLSERWIQALSRLAEVPGEHPRVLAKTFFFTPPL